MKLLPCPFCKKTDSLCMLWASELAGDSWDMSNNDSVQVVCDASTTGKKGGCGSASGFKDSEKLAAKAWNTRTPSIDVAAIREVMVGLSHLSDRPSVPTMRIWSNQLAKAIGD